MSTSQSRRRRQRGGGGGDNPEIKQALDDYRKKDLEIQRLKKQLRTQKTECDRLLKAEEGSTATRVDRSIRQISAVLNKKEGERNAFANVARDDRDMIIYKVKREQEHKRKAEDAKLDRIFYETRAFNQSVKQDAINQKLNELERTPHWDYHTKRKYKDNEVAYDSYVDRQKQLSRQQRTANKYRYMY